MKVYDLILRWRQGDFIFGTVRDSNGVETTGAIHNLPDFQALSPQEQTDLLISAAVLKLRPDEMAVGPSEHLITLARIEGVPEGEVGGKGLQGESEPDRKKAGNKPRASGGDPGVSGQESQPAGQGKKSVATKSKVKG